MSWGIGAVAIGATAAAAVGDAEFKELTVTKPLSKSSKRLFRSCARGEHFKQATLTARRKGGKDYFVITMTDVVITSYSVSSQSDVPTETISLLSANVDYEIPDRR